jgi:hypothetical protein
MGIRQRSTAFVVGIVGAILVTAGCRPPETEAATSGTLPRQVSETAAGFLQKSYTVRHRAVDELAAEAAETAEVVDLKAYFPEDFATDQIGMSGSGRAFVDAVTGLIVVHIVYGVGSIRGNPEVVCKSHLRRVRDLILGLAGPNVYGENLREILMMKRFGAAAADDPPAAHKAAAKLLSETQVSLQIIETDREGYHICTASPNDDIEYKYEVRP